MQVGLLEGKCAIFWTNTQTARTPEQAMIDTSPAIKALHAAYCRETGQQIELTMPRWFSLEAFRAKGWTEADLKLVVAHLQRKIRLGRKWPSALLFRNLIERLDYFEEELSEARAMARAPKIDKGKSDVLRATDRPHEPPTSECKTCEDIMQQHRQMAALLKEFRENHL